MTDRPWPAGAATGIGSWPGTDPIAAARLVFDELPDLPHLPELPARGAGADMIGRTAGLLVDLAVEIAPSGWRLASRPGRDLRRAQDFLARDLDALEAVADGYLGALKVQVTGPWTLAAGIEVPSGHRVVGDPGASRDLAESLAEGLRAHLSDVASRVPGARLVVQVDEPGVPVVLAGHVPTPSGFGSVRAVSTEVVEQSLRAVLDVAPAGGRVVHCCAADAPMALFRAAGADALAVDLALAEGQYDALGEAIDAGTSLWLGVLPTADVQFTRDTAREPIRRLWNALGFPVEELAAAVVPTPACGLAGATPDYARRVLHTLREVAHDMLELSA
jgi:Cobalamin-independent synthase, Catalytic domain